LIINMMLIERQKFNHKQLASKEEKMGARHLSREQRREVPRRQVRVHALCARAQRLGEGMASTLDQHDVD
jgi:hypothetical protein